jgi:MFS family permease
LLIGFFAGIAAFFPGLWLEARASQMSLYRMARTAWRILAPVVPAILVHFDDSGFHFRPDALSETSGAMLGVGITTGLIIHFVCSLLDRFYFPVKAHVLKQREQLAKGIQPVRPLTRRLFFGALWLIPIYILCKVIFMIAARELGDVTSAGAFNASYSTVVYVVSGIVWFLLFLFGVLPGTSKRPKMLVDPNLVKV